MVFLWKLMVISCLLAFHTTYGSINLTTSPQRINPMSTKDFTLNCTYEAEERTIFSLRLAKGVAIGVNGPITTDFVIMNDKSVIKILRPSPDVNYTGIILRNRKAYLSAKWNRVTKGLVGTYKCKVEVIDSSGFITSADSQIQVEEENATVALTVAAIMELQASNRELQTSIKELQTTEDEVQTHEHKIQEVKELLATTLNVLEKVTNKTDDTFYSDVYDIQYYIVYKTSPSTVRNAETYCQARGGYLAELNDHNEWKFVTLFLESVYLSSKNVDYYFISGRRNMANHKFYWPRMGKWTPAYFNWYSGQPDNWGDCVGISKYPTWQTFTWDCVYVWRIGFICEIPKVQ